MTPSKLFVFICQRHILNTHQSLLNKLAIRQFVDLSKILSAKMRTKRENESSAWCQLINESLRKFGCCSAYVDGVVRRFFSIAFSSISNFY